MFRMVPLKRRNLVITTIADDLDTLLGLTTYLGSRVQQVRVVPMLRRASVGLASSDAVLFYPDDFPQYATRQFLRRLRTSVSQFLVLIVTSCPERYQALNVASATSDRFIVLRSPAWPWELYATIHATLRASLVRRPSAVPC